MQNLIPQILSNKFYFAVLLQALSFVFCPPLYSESNNKINWTLIGPGDADQITSLTILEDKSVIAGTDIGGMYHSTDKGESWQAINIGLQNLDITTPILQHPVNHNILFVGTRGGLFKSNDTGSNWQRISKGLPAEQTYTISGSIGSIAIDNKNPNVMYLGLGYRPSYQGTTLVRRLKWSADIYKTENGGGHWEKIKAFDTPTKIHHIIVSKKDSSLLFAATDSGLYKSRNKGKDWLKVLSHPSYNVLQSAIDDKLILVSCGDKGVFKSTDAGSTWQASDTGLSYANFSRHFNNRYSVLASNPQSPMTVYVVNSTWGRSGGAYISNDFGENWSKITDDLPESWLKTSKRMNTIVANNNDLYLGSSRYLYSSNNNGKSWQQRISHREKDGWTHTGINVFGHTRTVLVDPIDAKIYYTATADHGLVRSINSGASWNTVSNNDKNTSDIWDITYCKSQPNEIIAISSGLKKELCVIKSKDKGENWEKSCNNIGKTGRDEKIIVNPLNCENIYIATKAGISYSINNGKSWRKFKHGAPTEKVYAISINHKIPGTLYAGTKKGMYVSNNSGDTWRTENAFKNKFVSAIYISPYDHNLIFAGTGNNKYSKGAIYKSTDAGKSWKLIRKNITSYVSAFSILPGNHDIIYATSMDQNFHDNSKGSGVFRSSNNGDNWQRVDTNLPVARAYNVTTSENLPNHVFISAAGGGAYFTVDR